MSFESDLRMFTQKVATRSSELFAGTVTAVRDSVVEGSPITGAPGQPVDTGNLKASWQTTFPEMWIGQVATNTEYAPPIEEGVGPWGPMTLRSQVGGFHSVKLTIAGFDRLVEDETRKLTGG